MAKQTKPSFDYDVLIAGAGAGGAICARYCAQAGLRTALIEKHAARAFGYPFVIEIEKNVFDQCDVPRPMGDEIAYEGDGQRVYTGAGAYAFGYHVNSVAAVKLGHTMRRLARYATGAGVEILWNTTVLEPLIEGRRVAGVRVKQSNGKTASLRARMVVDATGHAATLTRRLPAECGIDFTDRPADHVVAENHLYKIDPARAEEAIRQNRIEPEMVTIKVGVQGSYSTEMGLLSKRNGTAYILTGVKEDHSPPTPWQMIESWKNRMGFCAKKITGAPGTIRIRRASLRLVCDGFATIGEAASMVIPIHASGVGSAMLAGKALGQHLGKIMRGSENVPGTADLWPWAAEYQSGRGAVLAYYDAQRRVSEGLDPQTELWLLMTAGIMQPIDMISTITPTLPQMDWSTLPQRLRGIAQHPLLVAKFASTFPRLFQVYFHWRKFPPVWDESSFREWKTRAEALLP